MKYLSRWVAFLCLGLLAPPVLLADDAPNGRTPSVENQRVRLTYNLDTGLFDVVDLLSGKTSICGAQTKLEAWSSADKGCTRTSKITWMDGELGQGKKLTVKCARPDGPTLIAEYCVHGAEDSAVTFRVGLENTTAASMRVKEFHPLAGGEVFPGAAWSNIRTLNGDTACNQARVASDPYRNSANNLLLTFQQDGQRRSVVLGALKTAEFTKWASTMPEGGLDLRGLALSKALPGAKLVAYLDCGTQDRSLLLSGPVLSVTTGQPYTFSAEAGEERYGSLVHDGRTVVINAASLDPKKRYAVGFSWWDYDANGRVQSVIVRGKNSDPVTLFEKRALPDFTESKQPATELAAVVPPEVYADGAMNIRFTKDTKVANTVVSDIWLWEIPADMALPAVWNEGRPATKDIAPANHKYSVIADITGSDPVGKLVDAGKTYLPEDTFYLDCGTAEPFSALEKYGQQLRAATHANPNLYDFPTVCAWYAGVWKTPGAQNHPEKSTYKINTSPGIVQEIEKANERGFQKYSRVAGRLVPDTYAPLNPQGWWDDEHWRQGGYYVAPYDTTEKYGKAVHERGGLAFTYFQPTCLGGGSSRISKDFREQHTDWLCGKDVNRTLDYSQPAVQEHMRKVYANMRGNIDGLMIDYCDDFWSHEATQNAFADPYFTSTAFYRMFFKLAKDGLGPNSWLHERNLNQPNNDLTLGIVDLQRTSHDTDVITPEMLSRSGLRWYKNRVVLNYDMDSKELTSSWKVPGFGGSDEDGRRMMLTMAYVGASRLLLANSFRDLSPQTLHDLSRVVPFQSERRSARPVDAFVNDSWPRVYDFAVNAKWHQVTLYNNTLPTVESDFSIPLSGELVDGALGLDASKEYYAYDFWNNNFVGRLKGANNLKQTLRPGEARMVSLHEVEPNPQFISTSRHLMQGYTDMARQPEWNPAKRTLSGASKVVGGETYEVVLAMNGYRDAKVSAKKAKATIEQLPGNDGLALLKIDAKENATVEWEVVCKPGK